MQEEMGVTRSHHATHLDKITSMRLMRDACVTDGTAGAVSNYSTAMRGSGRERGGGGDEMSPCYPPRPDRPHAPDEERMRD